jgi:hypothetical protein
LYLGSWLIYSIVVIFTRALGDGCRLNTLECLSVIDLPVLLLSRLLQVRASVQSEVEGLNLFAALTSEIKIGVLLVKFIPGET